jgi:hypothetical protein
MALKLNLYLCGDKMKNLFIILTTIIVFTVFMTGCYTRLGTVNSKEDNSGKNYSNEQKDNYSDYDSTYDPSISGSNYGNYDYDGSSWYPRHHWSFSYYYPSSYWPSTAFEYVYNDPWFYSQYWNYDPWIGGTPYRFNPANYNQPYYAYPQYNDFWRSDNNIVIKGGEITKTRRDFGSTRDEDQRGSTIIDDRIDRTSTGGVSDLPTGVGVINSGGSSATGKTGATQTTSRTTSSTRQSATGTSQDNRGTTSIGSRRDRYLKDNSGQSTPPNSVSTPQVIMPATSSESRPSVNNGTQVQTYSPPPSLSSPSSQSPSNPPLQRDGSRDSGSTNSSSRGVTPRPSR